jgi:hypothetical protein
VEGREGKGRKEKGSELKGTEGREGRKKERKLVQNACTDQLKEETENQFLLKDLQQNELLTIPPPTKGRAPLP